MQVPDGHSFSLDAFKSLRRCVTYVSLWSIELICMGKATFVTLWLPPQVQVVPLIPHAQQQWPPSTETNSAHSSAHLAYISLGGVPGPQNKPWCWAHLPPHRRHEWDEYVPVWAISVTVLARHISLLSLQSLLFARQIEIMRMNKKKRQKNKTIFNPV